MAKTGWLGLPLFGFTPRDETVACVLSGGGSKASFQLGALAYLYEHDPEFRPTIFVGTSAGAILAAVLAQGASPAEQRGYVSLLADIWDEMTTSDDMFTPRPWMARARADMPRWLQLVESPAQPAATRTLADRLPFRRRPESVVSPVSAPEPLDPLEAALTPDEEVGPEWSLSDVATLMGRLGELPRLGSELAVIRRGMETTRSMYRPGPMLAKLLDRELFDENRVAASGMTLRVAMVSLESGHLHYLREDGRIVDRDDVVIDDSQYRLATGVLASCSIPGVFRPVQLGSQTYVDGGTRDTLPAELAIGHLRAQRTYVLSSQSVGVPARQSMADADLFSIVMRSMEILIDEAGRDELAYANSTDAIVINPTISVHDAMTVHPGLIRINSDYGWMRAAEETLGLGAEQEARTSRIVLLRMQALKLEQRIMDGEDNARTGARLASTKTELRDTVEACPAAVLPPGATQWWREFERHHPQQPTAEKSWLEV
ncbi:patatin-like phospholipase family protein [Tessaracoccus sp. OS52]|uniref:patatin-like phospholipase family protein n=1 Tax=Tessaracoccus sp. OS52 TaxID=2886691 RepID=UPI001D1003D1|nr:patatin-like phospholipase family protein [Tessaracoccus sp. OS52]MCC2592118.1 patatin-like phospholipase family protein [Tessaracoccus sp. OS52]